MSQMCPVCSRDNLDSAASCVHCAGPLRGLLGSHTLLESRYRVTRVLGCGGMGAVYLAEDARIPGRQVAVKENLDPRAQAQFQAEVGVMTHLNHPGLPTISDQFVGPAGRQYLVMDFIAGENLEELVMRRGPLPEPEVIALVTQLLDTLDYLHGNSILHRDIKPANIKLGPAGRPVLVDFGIARQHVAGSRTQTWARGVGSPGFAPAEQYIGGTDARSDLYSLGAVIYFLLTGQAPPEAPRLAAGAPLTPPRQLRPDVTLGLQRIIFRALAPAPNQRFQSADEMRRALAGLTQASGTTQVIRPPRPASRGLLVAAGVGAVALAVFALSLAAGALSPKPTPAAVGRSIATDTVAVTVVPAGGRLTTTPPPARGSDTAMPGRGSDTPTPAPPLATATLSQTPSVTASPTVSSTPTRTATATQTATATRTATRTYTPTPRPTPTPPPTPTPTPRPPEPIASNVSGFSGSQGGNGWWYQVERGRNSGDFQDFPDFAAYGSPSRNCWLTPQEGHVRICPEGEIHPGVTGRIAYRWRSSVSRTVRVTVHAHKMDPRGDGVWIGVFRVPAGRPPEKAGEFHIAGSDARDRPANTYNYNIGLSAGDWVMVMVDIRGDSVYDQTRLYLDIY